MTKKDDEHSSQETEQRFVAITRAVLSAKPIQKKDIPRKRPYRARKRSAKKAG
jgi:hypothetical protein